MFLLAVKRLMGREFDDPDVQRFMKNWPLWVIKENNLLKIQVQFKGEKKIFVPEQISSMILGKMKETAEAYVVSGITKVVITVPAYFNNAQREATNDAAKIAGLEVLRLISEPTAGKFP